MILRYESKQCVLLWGSIPVIEIRAVIAIYGLYDWPFTVHLAGPLPDVEVIPPVT